MSAGLFIGEKISIRAVRQILDAFPGFVFCKDREGRFTMLNKQTCDFYQHEEHELIGKTDEFLGHSIAKSESFRQTDQEVFRKKKSLRLPVNFLEMKDGSEHWFNIVKSPVFDDYGNVDQIMVACYEITDRIQSELELKENEEKFRDLFENVSDAIYVIDLNGVFQESNKAGNLLLGVENAVGRSIAEFVHEESKEAPLEYLKSLDTSGFVKDFHVKLDIDGDERIIEINSTAIYNEEGKRIGSRDIIRNISERIAYQNQLIDARNSAEDITKLQANFLANMSHEIRTPINGIIGLAELIEQDFSNVEGLDEYAQLLKESGHRLLSTITSLLDFSKLNNSQVDFKLREFDLVQVVQDYLPSMHVLADRKGLYLRFKTEIKHLDYRFDENVLILILNNLIGNAIKFTKEGGVEVRLTTKDVQGKEFIQLSIHDTGIGIDEEFVPFLFEPFRQESTGFSRNYEGTGLGLSIVHKYIELFGGYVKVKSEKKQGASFYIFLPRQV